MLNVENKVIASTGASSGMMGQLSVESLTQVLVIQRLLHR